nr:large-conductance mechanosensitive channel protein MscL [Corynebacterium yudongzhengii]
MQGFKEFIMRGNVIDLAVAVVIGAAFTNIVTALTDNFIYPLIAVLGDPEVGGLSIQLRADDVATTIDFSAIITAVINFLLIAAVVYFFIVMPMNKLQELQKRRSGVEEEAEDPTETQLLTEIRDLLADERASANNPSTGGAHRAED